MELRGVRIFALPGSDILAKDVCRELNERLPRDLKPNGEMVLNEIEITRFSNENIQIQIPDIRGHFVVVIHTMTPPVNEGLIQLFTLLDAIKNSRAADLLLVFPYMPYARSDRKNKPRISTMGHRIPHMLAASLGVQRVILLDPHDTHTKHYFEPSADEISALYLLADMIVNEVAGKDKKQYIIAFPDAGAARRFEKLPEITGLDFDYIDKVHRDDKENLAIKKEIFAAGKTCIIVDDEVMSGSTALKDAAVLKKNGAKEIWMLFTHPVLADQKSTISELINRLEDSAIDRFIFTDSIPCQEKIAGRPKFTVLSVAGLLAEAIKRTIQNESLTALHDPKKVGLYRPH